MFCWPLRNLLRVEWEKSLADRELGGSCAIMADIYTLIVECAILRLNKCRMKVSIILREVGTGVSL